MIVIHNNYTPSFIIHKTIEEDGGKEWHKLRLNGFGGSDLGSILNLNAYDVKAREKAILKKCGVKIPFTGNKEMADMGNILEKDVVEMYKQATGYNVEIYKDRIFFNPENPRLQISSDGIAVLPDGTKRNLEVKCYWKKDKFLNDVMTADYYAQAQGQMYALGLNQTDFACYYVPKKHFHIIKVSRNNDYIEIMLDEINRAWKEVEKKRLELKYAP